MPTALMPHELLLHPVTDLAFSVGPWLAGRESADAIVTRLRRWGAHHRVLPVDAAAAPAAALAPRGEDGPAALLALLRRFERSRGTVTATDAEPLLSLRLPAPGDARGLAPGDAFAPEAMRTGGALLLCGRRVVPGGDLVPLYLGITVTTPALSTPGDAADAAHDGAVSWRVHLPYSPPAPPEHLALGEAEYALREAVREAIAVLRDGPGSAVRGDEDAHRAVADLLADVSEHGRPEHLPARILRVLETADQVAAIVAVARRRFGDAAPVHALGARVRAAREAAALYALRS